MSRFIFIHPPYTELESMPLRMLNVATRVAQGGGDVEVLDANSACFRTWLDVPFLRGQMARMERVVHRLTSASELAADDAYTLHRAVRGTVGGEKLLAALPAARATLDRPRSKRVVESALDIALWPARGVATLGDLTLASSTERIADVVAMASAPPDANRFVRFWQGWLEDRRFAAPATLVLWLEADQQLFPAVTLARLMRSRGPDLRLVLAGPFAAFLKQASKTDRWWASFFDDIAPAELDARPTDDLDPALLTSFVEERLLGEPAVVPIEVPTAAAIGAAHAAFPNAVLHLTQPQRVTDLALLDGQGARLSAVVKFGFALDRDLARELRRGGFETLHFEVKGHAGYKASEEAARESILESFAAARNAEMTTLASLVYGYPTDRASSFERFATAIASEKDSVDRWVRMKIYRLYRFSPAWARPSELGITARFAPPADRELARHVAFTTASGLDSRQFATEAQKALALFDARSQDFPRSPILSDDAGLRTEERIAPVVPLIPRDAWLEAAPRTDVRTLPFSFAELDATFGSFVPGPNRRVPDKRFLRADSHLTRSVEGDTIKTLNSGIMKLLDACAEPRRASDLFERVDGRVVNQLVGLGLVRVKEMQDVQQ